MNTGPIFQFDRPTNTVDALRRAISNRLVYQVGKDLRTATPRDWLFAVVHAARDRIIDTWRESLAQASQHDAKRVHYLSMEYLTGRALTNALLATDIYEPIKQACNLLGADFDALVDLEPDAGLGNGGLGRLAACFLDSIASLGLPGIGYGIRYEYGMFSQRIENGQQVEEPDYWLTNGYPWEFMRPELSYTIRYGGRLVPTNGHSSWVDTEDVIATAYDSGVPGYQMRSVITMRLWSARATRGINLTRSTGATISRHLKPRTSPKTSRAYSTRTTAPNTDASCGCVKSTFLSALRYRTYCAATSSTTTTSTIWQTRWLFTSMTRTPPLLFPS